LTTRNSRASKRWMMAAAAAVACGSTLALAGSASAGPGADAPDAERIAGANRFGTAAAISQEFTNDDVVIVNGLDFPDGLAAAVYGDRILLTEKDELPAETVAELKRIYTEQGDLDIKIAGGTSVVSSAVFEQLSVISGGEDPQRLAGSNRYETAIKVAADYGVGSTVILATGVNFPDALAAGPLSATGGYPILLNNGTTVRPDVAKFLLDAGVTDVIIVGGETVIPATVETQLTGSLGLDVERLAGSNRAGTAVAIADYMADQFGTPSGLLAVNGTGFADALAAGPLGYWYYYPILLVEQNSIPAATAEYHVANCLVIEDIIAIGGTAVISNAVVTGAVGAATCAAPAISSATLLNNDFKQTVFTPNAGLTVTADAGTPAQGAAANAWQFAYVQNGTPGTEGVAIDTTLTTYAKPTFVVTANFNNLTNQGFVNVWNASPAAALTTAATTDPTGLFPLGTGAAAPGNVAAPITTPGSQDTTVVVTFERAVTAATPSGLYPNLNPATPAALGAPTTTSTIPAAGTTTVTYVWQDNTNPLAIPSLPNYQIRFAVGSIEDAVTGFTNVLVAAKTLVAAS
jgi:putative cell wall-binding protein